MTCATEPVFRPVLGQTHRGRGLEIRPLVREDFAALVQLYKAFEPKRVAQGLPPPDVPRIAHWLDRLEQKSQALLAWHGGKIVGHAILCPMKNPSVEFTIFVHQDFREEGLGTCLSRHTLEWALSMGFELAYLTTETSNFRAVRLFRKLGFHITSIYGDEIEMNLELGSRVCECSQAA
jgi:ribosomal protein S18 acetylase RimI-like enzyme